ncbi:MAG: glycoside hydrolase family 28 protein, partial [Clostridia bacterium]|nr:glycoside hydrolase family 28 protein [Clostridia bacterium]
MLKPIFTSSTSICMEWQNNLPYYTEKEYTILLDGKQVGTYKTNIFSLFDLLPSTTYEISVKDT